MKRAVLERFLNITAKAFPLTLDFFMDLNQAVTGK
jgi:hypothetical protein